MDMGSIMIAVGIVAVIGLIAGLGLSIASKIFAVPVDEKAEAIRECLPGANCGACGFSGCDGYAAALSKGETTDTALCAPGGNDVAPGNSFSGDNLTANVNSGELILNRAQQGAIAGQLEGNPMNDLNLGLEVEGTKMLLLLNNTNRSLGGSRSFYSERH